VASGLNNSLPHTGAGPAGELEHKTRVGAHSARPSPPRPPRYAGVGFRSVLFIQFTGTRASRDVRNMVWLLNDFFIKKLSGVYNSVATAGRAIVKYQHKGGNRLFKKTDSENNCLARVAGVCISRVFRRPNCSCNRPRDRAAALRSIALRPRPPDNHIEVPSRRLCKITLLEVYYKPEEGTYEIIRSN